MMSEEISSEKVYKTRSVLGDITNQAGKRGISLISSSDVKSTDGSICHVEKKAVGSQITKKVCARMENLAREGIARVSPHTCSEINSLKGNVISGISKIASGIKEPGLADGVTQIDGADVITDKIVNLDDAKKDSCILTIPSPTVPCEKYHLDVRGEIHEDKGLNSVDADVKVRGELHKDKGLSSVDADVNDLQEELETSEWADDENDLNSSKDGNVDFSRLPESKESGISGLERSIGLKVDGCSNSSEGVDVIKACSCSFCTKAAYIWSDLHYQDMKGRIGALKKSQKDARILAHRSFKDIGHEKRGQGSSNKVSRLESDLTGHWTSLFLRTEDILVRECRQLEASLLFLKDLRDNCKTELELMTRVPADAE